jgi:hypothetical protein
MAKAAQFCLVVPNTGRSISDDAWQTIDVAHIDIWKSATSLLRERKLVSEQTTYTITADWTSALRRYEKHYSAMMYLERNKEKTPPNDLYKRVKFPRRPSKNIIKVSARGNNSLNLMSIAENAIFNFFLIMNIAAPGCCNFYRASLSGRDYEPSMSMTNAHFEAGLLTYLDGGWPVLQVMKLEKVISWFDSVRGGISQVPQNPMEKVLFALLHMAKIDVSPILVIWLFYAFESLLQTRVGENFSSLVSRLCLLLETSEKEAALLKKKMRALYDIRNAIVHGGFEVAHPMHNELLDRRVENSFGRLMNATDYGNAILLASIQKTIENGWRFPQFEESVRGEPFQRE